MGVKNAPINKQTIMDIFRDIVMCYPFSKGNRKTINTFANAFDGEIFGQDSNGGFTYESFENGEFWSRDWVASGASKDTLKKQYPILAVESKAGGSGDICKTPIQWCNKFYVVVGDLKECKECPDSEFRTPNQIECDTEQMLKNAFIQFLSYAAYEDTATGKCVWLPEKKYQKVIAENPTALIELPQTILSNVQNEKVSTTSWGEGYNHLRATKLEFTICGCTEETIEFNNNLQTTKQDYDAVTVCSCC